MNRNTATAQNYGAKLLAETICGLKKTVMKNNQKTLLSADTLDIAGFKNSKYVTLSLSNANARNSSDIVIGTPLGIATEYLAVPLSATLPNIMFTMLADLSDQQGVGLNFLQLFNKRVVRNPLLVSYIEVIVPTGALGEQQKGITPRLVTVPYNSATDSALTGGLYNASFTEFTGVNLLSKGYTFSDFVGMIYELLPSSSAKLNIHLAAIDSPVFLVNQQR